MNAGKTEFAVFFAFATLAHAALILSLKVPHSAIVLPRPSTILFRFDELAPQPAAPAREASAPSPASAPASAARSEPDSAHVAVAKTKILSPAKPEVPLLTPSKSFEPRFETGKEAATSWDEKVAVDDQREQRRTDESAQSQVASLPRAASSPAAKPRTEPASAEASMEIVRANYEQVLAAWLDRHKYYPAPLRRRGFEGSGEMRIRIDRHGTVLYAAMSKRLPYTTLDEVALDWADRANPFPELPESIAGESYEFLAPVEFAIR